MKSTYIKSLIAALAVAGTVGFTGCTDDFEALNTNPNKVYDVELNDVFAGTVQRTMNVWAEMNYRQFLNKSRLTVVMFCAGPNQDTGDGYFRNFYVNIIRDLVKLERKYSADEAANCNRLAIAKIWKSYCFYTLASCYGPIPMSDAVTDGSENKRYYKYDSELEVYTQIMEDLKKAVEYIDNADPNLTSDRLEYDPIFGVAGPGTEADMTKWLKFANTLRLNVAMHMQNLDMELSKAVAAEVLADGRLISNNDENVVAQWGQDSENSSSYYYRSFTKNQTRLSNTTRPALSEYGYIYQAGFNDPRIPQMYTRSNDIDDPNFKMPISTKPFLFTDTITRPHVCSNRDQAGISSKCPNYSQHRADGQNAYRFDSITVTYTVDYVPMWEGPQTPSGWEWGIVPGYTYRYSDPLIAGYKDASFNSSFIRIERIGEQAKWYILTYADACFLRAEYEMVHNGNAAAAKTAYEEGIKASMDQYGVSAADANAYLQQNGVKWGTSKKAYADRRQLYRASINGANGVEGKVEQILKQRCFADIFNGLEIWNIERRARIFNFPPVFSEGPSGVEGADVTFNFCHERMIYPDPEMVKNGVACKEGVQMIRAVSPYTRDERDGNNVFTILGFAKMNPQLATAKEDWQRRVVVPRMEYYEHTYGVTWEECVAAAKAKTGKTSDKAALKEIAFEYASQISVFVKFPWE